MMEQGQATMREKSREMAGKVQETAGQFRDKAQEWQRRATETARNASRAADDYVHENPWAVVGSVAAVCFVVGFLIGRSGD